MNRSRLVSIVASVAGFIIAMAAFAYFERGEGRSQNKKVGSIEAITGIVMARMPLAPDYVAIAAHDSIENQEVISTNRASEAIVVLNGGTRIKIDENSKLIIEQNTTAAQSSSAPGNLRLTILEGDIAIIEWATGKRDNLEIFQSGQNVSAALSKSELPISIGRNVPRIFRQAMSAPMDSSTTIPVASGLQPAISVGTPEAISSPTPLNVESANATPSASPHLSPGTTAQEKPPVNSATLTDDEIKIKMRAQMSFLQRCYLNYLGTSGTSQSSAKKGTIVVSFDIETTGHVSHSHIVRSEMPDAALNRCVLEVIERTNFRGFNGDKITVGEFPILLE